MPMLQEQLAEQDVVPDVETASRRSDSIPAQDPASMSVARRLSEESIRTDLCEGPVPDSPRPGTPEHETSANAVSDRAELIERLKRGESPTWIPNRHLGSLFHQNGPRSPSRSPRSNGTSPTLLPAADIMAERTDAAREEREAEIRLQQGMNIERPRSALHSGNFAPDEGHHPPPDVPAEQELARGGRGGGGGREGGGGGGGEDEELAGHSRPDSHPWISTSPPRTFTPFTFEGQAPSYRREAFLGLGTSLSSSLSSSFVYKPPTSPLARSESNNEDVGFPPFPPSSSIDIDTRSLTSSPRHALNLSQSSPHATTAMSQEPPHVPALRRGGGLTYQAHQPRRSLVSASHFELGGDGWPQTPGGYLRSRRTSYSSDASPMQHASMVGSYEESILRGRMSTTPSRPLEFTAQIGVLGLGKCKSSLRCPPHVALPFSAVFYSYAHVSNGRSKMEEGPSPYVGQIDLENGLPNSDEEQRTKRKMQSRHADRVPAEEEEEAMRLDDAGGGGGGGGGAAADASEVDARKSTKHKRRSRSPRAPAGGRYRIPEKGQVQIVIKNQNKTAVKLFLVPYDLAGMEPGTKTFVRQRSYSAGPIIDNVPNLKETGAADHPVLRYLIHLQVCCPAKGRFYLYKNIRVVFANRVPDGKEKLRNEVTYPEPRFSPYKPGRASHLPPAGPPLGGAGGMLAAEQAFRRRSPGFAFAHGSQALLRPQEGVIHHAGFSPPSARGPTPQQGSLLFGGAAGATVPVVEPGPFFRFPQKAPQSELSDGSDSTTVAPVRSPLGSLPPPPPPLSSHPGTQGPMGGGLPGMYMYDKLSKGDVGYGGNAFAPHLPGSPGGAAEGLLSKRLRSLGVQNQGADEDGRKTGE